MKFKEYLREAGEGCYLLEKQARKENRQVFICGNGGSAGTSIHMAADLFKMGNINAISLNENIPLTTAIINDDGWENLYTKQLENLFNSGDVLICISVHGGKGKENAEEWSQNINKAVSYVKVNKGKVIGLTGFDGGSIKYTADVCLIVPIQSTPLVESFHVLLHHYIAFKLYKGERI